MAKYMNDYEKMAKGAVKVLNKSDRVTLARKADNIFISNSFFALRVNRAIYEYYFRPAAPYFVPLEDGEGASMQRTAGDAMPQKCPPVALWDCIPKAETLAHDVNITPLTMEVMSSITPMLRVCISDEGVTMLDEKLYGIVKGVGFTNTRTAGRLRGIVFDRGADEDEPWAYILPIRHDVKTIDELIMKCQAA